MYMKYTPRPTSAILTSIEREDPRHIDYLLWQEEHDTPFLEYCYSNWASHAAHCQPQLLDLVRSVLSDSQIRQISFLNINNSEWYYKTRCIFNGSWFHLLVYYGLDDMVRAACESGEYKNFKILEVVA